jgi:hypothetical protein
MKIKIELDTERHPVGASVCVDGVRQGNVQEVLLDMSVDGIKDLRLKRSRIGNGEVTRFVEQLEGSKLVIPDGQ